MMDFLAFLLKGKHIIFDFTKLLIQYFLINFKTLCKTFENRYHALGYHSRKIGKSLYKMLQMKNMTNSTLYMNIFRPFTSIKKNVLLMTHIYSEILYIVRYIFLKVFCPVIFTYIQ